MVPGVLAKAAARFEAVAETAGREQADTRALTLQQGVGRDGGAVQEKLAVAEEIRQCQPKGLARGVQCRNHAFARVVRNRRHLEHIRAAFAVGDHEVRKRAADIDADAPRWRLNAGGHGPSPIR